MLSQARAVAGQEPSDQSVQWVAKAGLCVLGLAADGPDHFSAAHLCVRSVTVLDIPTNPPPPAVKPSQPGSALRGHLLAVAAATADADRRAMHLPMPLLLAVTLFIVFPTTHLHLSML